MLCEPFDIDRIAAATGQVPSPSKDEIGSAPTCPAGRCADGSPCKRWAALTDAFNPLYREDVAHG